MARRTTGRSSSGPLFGTSFLIDDFLDEGGYLDDAQVVISSASSKTASGHGIPALAPGGRARGGPHLARECRTSWRALGRVRPAWLAYDDLAALDDGPTVYVDISGDAGVRAAVHERFGESLAYDCLVGAAHWDQVFVDAGPLAGPAPEMFFAPARFAKRTTDWGPEGLQSRVSDAWDPFGEWLSGWLRVIHGSGPEDLERAYLELVEGDNDPATGYVMSLRRMSEPLGAGVEEVTTAAARSRGWTRRSGGSCATWGRCGPWRAATSSSGRATRATTSSSWRRAP